MSKVSSRFYAVRIGREGSKIYTSWDEAKENVNRFPGAVYMSFRRRDEADAWIAYHSSIDEITLAGIRERQAMSAGPSSQASSSSVGGASSSPYRYCKSEPRHTWRALSSHPQTSPGPLPESDTGSDGHWSDPPPPETHIFPKLERGLPVLITPLEELVKKEATLAPAPVPAPAPAPPSIQLSDEQRAVLDMVKRGKSIFFTGSAGTGKSVLLREIISHCRLSHHGRVAVTASTGIAAVNIGGSTVHSWAGIGLGKESADKLAAKLLGLANLAKRKLQDGQIPPIQVRDKMIIVERWKAIQTLIIDEISMIDGVLFDKLEYIARVLRGNDAPFGGIQLVLSGDFCQLPPVPDHDSSGPKAPTFAFDARTWDHCVGRPILLTKVFRQKDQEFVDILNSIRFGKLDPRAVKKLRSLSRSVEYDDGIEPTELFPVRREVDSANYNRLGKLEGHSHKYVAIDTPGYDAQDVPIGPDQMKRLLERLVAPGVVVLKVGAQVMLVKNMVQGELVNGSLGRVIDFKTTGEAATASIKIASVDTPQPPPQSRDLKSAHKPARKLPPLLEGTWQRNTRWPVVKFQTATMLCIPATFEVNGPEGNIEAMRMQVPLILAWALSIHKSQGQTLERVHVNLGRVFEKGQAYVALSRATSMDALQVTGFDPRKIVAHPRVLTWMEEHDNDSVPSEVDEALEFWADL